MLRLITCVNVILACVIGFLSTSVVAAPVLVKGGAGTITDLSQITTLTNLNNTLYFVGTNTNSGKELWKSDGTDAGTVMVKDIRAGSGSSSPQQLTVVGNTLFFTADDFINGRELWKSDGTAAGTVMVKNIQGAVASSPTNLTSGANNTTLFFTVSDGVNGVELWKSDGTDAGTAMVKDINVTGDSSPWNLTDVNGLLYFSADDGVKGRELWKSDGTAVGTSLVFDITTLAANGSNASSPEQLAGFNGSVYFQADDGVTGIELWTSDGTTTSLVKDIYTGATGGVQHIGSPANLMQVNGKLFFTAATGYSAAGSYDVELWLSDGTAGGTTQLKDIYAGVWPSTPRGFTNVNTTLFFVAGDGTDAEGLWKSDGTSGGTTKVAAFPYTSYSPVVSNNKYYAFLFDGASASRQLWESDGTSAGTVLVKDLTYSSAVGAYPPLTNLVDINGELYFAANGMYGEELWKLSSAATATPAAPTTPTTPAASDGGGGGGCLSGQGSLQLLILMGIVMVISRRRLTSLS